MYSLHPLFLFLLPGAAILCFLCHIFLTAAIFSRLSSFHALMTTCKGVMAMRKGLIPIRKGVMTMRKGLMLIRKGVMVMRKGLMFIRKEVTVTCYKV